MDMHRAEMPIGTQRNGSGRWTGIQREEGGEGVVIGIHMITGLEASILDEEEWVRGSVTGTGSLNGAVIFGIRDQELYTGTIEDRLQENEIEGRHLMDLEGAIEPAETWDSLVTEGLVS